MCSTGSRRNQASVVHTLTFRWLLLPKMPQARAGEPRAFSFCAHWPNVTSIIICNPRSLRPLEFQDSFPLTRKCVTTHLS